MCQEHATILLIEDNPGDVRLIREMLSEGTGAAHSMEWVESLRAGMQRITQGGIDLVLLDLGLPESTGLETFRRLRADIEQLPPVVVMSVLGDDAIAAQAVSEGAQDYLIKGQVDGNLLRRSIRYAIERNKVAVALQQVHDDLENQVRERTAALASAIESLQRENAERKQAEEELRKKEQQIRSLLDTSEQSRCSLLSLLEDQQRTEEVLNRLNRKLRANSKCNEIMIRATEEQALLNDICRIICDEADYPLAWVGYAENNEVRSVRPVAWGGSDGEYVANAKLSWADDVERGRGPGGTAIQSGEIVYVQDSTTDPRMTPWRESALRRGYRSVIGLPLKNENAIVFGVLLIYSTEINAFTLDEIKLLEELSDDMAFGITVLRDRTELMKAEQRNIQLAAIVESSDDAITSKTLDGIITSWNKGAEKIYGYTESEMIGNSIFTTVPTEFENEELMILEKIKTGGHIEHFETVRQRKDGLLIHVFLMVSPVFDESGNIIGASTIGRNITERRRAEEEIRKLNQELEQRVADRTSQLEIANKELEAFAYSVSHDLRAPLRHIDGFVGLLQKETDALLNEQSRYYMDTISNATKKMGLLIDDLLSFSRMGRQALSFQPVNLGTLVSDVIRSFEADVVGREIEWRIGGLPAVRGDAAMLRMVLVNLVANALKFTQPRRQAQIEIGSLPDQTSEAVIFVRDNGVGFDMTYADKLFGVFQRLHRADEFEGTGIGLANVRRIISRHGGRTWAEGKPDQGAVFYFSLPQKEQQR